MARQVALFLFFAAMASVSGCKEIQEAQLAKVPPPVAFNGIQEISYDASQGMIRISGALQTVDATPLTQIEFHGAEDCKDAAFGKGTAKDFPAPGIVLKIPYPSSGPQVQKIYLLTNTAPDCYYVGSYDPAHLPPAPPVFTQSSPASPSRLSTTPTVYGTLTGSVVRVFFFSDSACTQAVGNGMASDFLATGTQLSLPSNATTQVYAQSVEPFGLTSACTAFYSYTHDASAPVAPQFVSTDPLSPNNTSNSPNIKGISSADAVTINLFSDAACASPLATGPKADFDGSGIQVQVNANSTTSVYAQSVNLTGGVSACTYMTDYVNSLTPPDPPTFAAVNPPSPTRLTLFPKLTGSAAQVSSPSVASILNFYSDAKCAVQVGTGSVAAYQSSGVVVTVTPNAVTTVYAQTVDAAGNASDCTHLTDFTHDTIAPDPPVYQGTSPISPNNITNAPFVVGATPEDAVSVTLYSDYACTQALGSDTAEKFNTTGIKVTLGINMSSPVYAASFDRVGNKSLCMLMTNYAYSNLPAPAPSYFTSVPQSPTNMSFMPYIQGTLDRTIVNVQIYNDSACTNRVGRGTKVNYISTGIQAFLSPNTTNDLYGITTDIYGNISPCTYLTQFTHDNLQPDPPSYLATSPVSPNNTSYSPIITGVATAGTVIGTYTVPITEVGIFDSPVCGNRVGVGPRTLFQGAGIPLAVGANVTTKLYAKLRDLAGNASACTYLTDYTHDSIKPIAPTYQSLVPGVPDMILANTLRSYTSKVQINGKTSNQSVYAKLKFDSASAGLTQPAIVSASLYLDPACTLYLGGSVKGVFDTVGVVADLPKNQSSAVYAQSTDWVGNISKCVLWQKFNHSDAGPRDVSAFQYGGGSIELNWLQDPYATSFIVKRALTSGGPYTIIDPGIGSSTVLDYQTLNNVNYYYVVQSVNSTGASLDSLETAVTTAISVPPVPTNLKVIEGDAEASLTWDTMVDAAYYNVYRAPSAGGPYTKLVKIMNSTASNQSYLDNTVVNDQVYYYVVTGVNANGESAYPPEIGVIPRPMPPSPTMVQGVWNGGNWRILWIPPPYSQGINFYACSSCGGVQAIPSMYYTTIPAGTTYADVGAGGAYGITAKWGTRETAIQPVGVAGGTGSPTMSLYAGDGYVNLSWGTSYAKVVRQSSLGGPMTTLYDGYNFGGSGLTDSGVTNGNTYYYTLYDQSATPPLGVSAIYSGVPRTIPSPPSSLVGSAVGSSFRLDWAGSINYGPQGYRIYRSTAPGGPFTYLSATMNNSWTDGAPLVGMNYYRVTGVWAGSDSSPTNVVSFRRGTVTGLGATQAATKVTLTWSSTPGASPGSYIVGRSTMSGGPYTTITSSASSGYDDTTVSPNQGYYYVVTPQFPDATVGQQSAEVSAMPGTGTTPSGLTVVGTSSSTATLRWVPVKNATNYQVYRSPNGNNTWSPINPITTLTNFTAVGLSAGSTFFFRVAAKVGGVFGAPSSNVSARAIPIGVGQPTNTVAGPSSLTVTWSYPGGGSNLVLYRSTDLVNWSSIYTGGGTSYTDATVTTGVQYYYRISADFPPAGTYYSSASMGAYTGQIPQIPGAPYEITNNTGNSLSMGSAGSPGASINYYVSSVSGGPYSYMSSNGVISGLTQGVPVYVVCNASYAGLSSGYSQESMAVPFATPPAPSVTGNSAGTIVLSWPAIAGAVSYDLLRANNTVSFNVLATGLGSPNYVDASANAGWNYRYQYRARLASGYATPFSYASAVVATANPLAVPIGLGGKSTGSTTYNLTWFPVYGAVSYNVYRSTVSGGPYTLMTNTTATNYFDTGLNPATVYYYTVTVMNVYNVESGFSSQVGMSTAIVAPTGVAASVGSNVIAVSWNASAGAATYRVGRSSVSGGPYAFVANGLTGTSFTDTTVRDGVTYYYVIQGNAANGAISTFSAEASATAIVKMNLEVPIELTDQALASSDTGATLFERTRTTYDPTEYDGTIATFFEAIVLNNDSGVKNVKLLNSAGGTTATIAVPANTTLPFRIRVPFTPAASNDIYRIQLDATSLPGQLQVLSAKALVQQTNATKTRIYIPLMASNSSASSLDAAAPLVSSSANAYAPLDQSSVFVRDSTQFSRFRLFNAWNLEVVVASTGNALGSVALFDDEDNRVVLDTETMFSQGTPAVVNSTFDEGITGFDASTEGHHFEMVLKCFDFNYNPGCANGSVSVYKAGLWVSLFELKQTEVYYRNVMGPQSFGAATVFDQARVLINTSLFSNPTAFFQMVAAAPPGPPSPSNLSVVLQSVGTTDAGQAGVDVGGSALVLNNPFKTWMRSGSLTLTPGHRFVIKATPDIPNGTLVDGTVVIRSAR